MDYDNGTILAEELYDLSKDIDTVENQVDEPMLSDKKEELGRRLQEVLSQK